MEKLKEALMLLNQFLGLDPFKGAGHEPRIVIYTTKEGVNKFNEAILADTRDSILIDGSGEWDMRLGDVRFTQALIPCLGNIEMRETDT